VEPGREFLSSGFDSLSVTELRNKLNQMTGLKLSSMAVFDSKTPRGLAELVRRAVAEQSHAGKAGPQAAGQQHADSVCSLIRDAVDSGKITEAFGVMRAIANIRPSFASVADLGSVTAPTTLTDGPPGVRLIALSSPMADGGVHQHARLAAHFQGVMRVSAVSLPGFSPGEKLPATGEVAVAAAAESVRLASAGDPFVILGHSAGGALAYAAAHYLETRWQIQPAAVILVDTFRLDDPSVPIDQVLRRMLSAEPASGTITSDRLSAMGRWLDALSGLRLEPVTTQVLFIQATKPFSGPAHEASRWLARPFEPAHALRTVQADHFTIATSEAEQTSHVIQEWLGTTL
jgi:pimeloyl-ACP methyl ester carboxylesterase